MSQKRGRDLAAGGEKFGSFQTSEQRDGSPQMFVCGPDGAHLHVGAAIVNGIIDKTFAIASNASGQAKIYAGDGVERVERSTEALATLVVEELERGGKKRVYFEQGQYRTNPVVVPAYQPARPLEDLSWPRDCRRAEYAVSVYDALSVLSTGGTQTTIPYSSNISNFGTAFTLRRSMLWEAST
jgi:hypothetical protein